MRRSDGWNFTQIWIFAIPPASLAVAVKVTTLVVYGAVGTMLIDTCGLVVSGVGVGPGVSDGLGDGVGVSDGLGDGVGVSEGVGLADGDGDGVGSAEARVSTSPTNT